MATLAREVMTPDPARCSPATTLDQVAKMMVQHDCGEIPVVDTADRPVGVITDRDIVCRLVAEGLHPGAHTSASIMSTPVVTVSQDSRLDDVIAAMEKHRIRRVPVVDAEGCCVGIIAQADIAVKAPGRETAELVREVSRDPNRDAARST